MNVTYSYVVGGYAVSLFAAMFATRQTFLISRAVLSRRLRNTWLTITLTSGCIEVLHGWTVIHLARMANTAPFLSSTTIMLGAGAMFACLATLMRASIKDVIEIPSLQKLAFRDPLTGIGNRRAFEQEIDAAANKALPSLIMVDIDHFKSINDEHGHDAGDMVLKRVAMVIDHASCGHAVYRLGGEEFALFSDVGAPDAVALAETCRLAVARIILLRDGQSIAPTISAGVAALRPGETVSSLRRRADVALYHAKRFGRNRVSEWSPSMEDETARGRGWDQERGAPPLSASSEPYPKRSPQDDQAPRRR